MTRLDEAGDGAVITRQELADSLGISRKTLYRYIAKGLLPPPVFPTGKSFFLVGSVRSYLKKQEKKAIKAHRAGTEA